MTRKNTQQKYSVENMQNEMRGLHQIFAKPSNLEQYISWKFKQVWKWEKVCGSVIRVTEPIINIIWPWQVHQIRCQNILGVRHKYSLLSAESQCSWTKWGRICQFKLQEQLPMKIQAAITIRQFVHLRRIASRNAQCIEQSDYWSVTSVNWGAVWGPTKLNMQTIQCVASSDQYSVLYLAS